MGIFTPPGKSDKRDANEEKPTLLGSNSKDETDVEKFWVRPSLGLKLWGPLVPASDNKTGLWTLVAVQSMVGLLCFYRFKSLRIIDRNGALNSVGKPGIRPTSVLVNEPKIYNSAFTQQEAVSGKPLVKKDIADFPTLNRFSTTHGDMFVNTTNVNRNTPSLSAAPVVASPVMSSAGHQSEIMAKSEAKNNWKSFFKSDNWLIFKKVFYLLAGSIILSQSMLEACRLTILRYDPWCEEAKTVREKKFFNNIVKFYHEGIDPTKVKVKDAVSGNIMPTNVPEVRQSVALVRAQTEAENPIISWFGPIEYKPMTFSEFLDRLEYHLDMFEYFQGKRAANETALGFLTGIKTETSNLRDQNAQNRSRILKELKSEDQLSNDLSIKTGNVKIPKGTHRHGFSAAANRSIILEEDVAVPEDIDLNEIWTLYDPWLNLALETSLSIKFIPTVLINQDGITENSMMDTEDTVGDKAGVIPENSNKPEEPRQ
ncbi:Mgr1-like, i-AAA protease complex subunit [Nakaseomyces glabratus]